MNAEEILKKVANEHSYETWGELMYDTHEHSQIEYTKEAIFRYSKQQKLLMLDGFLEMIDTADLKTKQQFIDLVNTERNYIQTEQAKVDFKIDRIKIGCTECGVDELFSRAGYCNCCGAKKPNI